MIKLVYERPEHAPAVERLVDSAFGEERWAKTCQRLRDGREHLPGLSLVALDGEKLVGTVRLWRVDAGRKRTLLLGPLAVDAGCREQGIGSTLMEEALKAAKEAGEESVILVGDAPYYGRFGFRRDLTTGLWMPGPVDRERFLARELVSGALDMAEGPVLALAA